MHKHIDKNDYTTMITITILILHTKYHDHKQHQQRAPYVAKPFLPAVESATITSRADVGSIAPVTTKLGGKTQSEKTKSLHKLQFIKPIPEKQEKKEKRHNTDNNITTSLKYIFVKAKLFSPAVSGITIATCTGPVSISSILTKLSEKTQSERQKKLWRFICEHNEKKATNIKFPLRSTTYLAIKTVSTDTPCSSSPVLIFSAGVPTSFGW